MAGVPNGSRAVWIRDHLVALSFLATLLGGMALLGAISLERRETGAERLLAGSLDTAIARSADYLRRQLRDNGQFIYRINMDPTVEVTAKYNLLRHAGTMYSLFLAHEFSPQPEIVDTLAQAERFLMTESYGEVAEAEDAAALWSRPEWGGFPGPERAKLGGTGLGLVALLSLEQARPGSTDLEALRKLGRFLIFMQRGDGSFSSKYVLSRGQWRRDAWVSLYYPGEAALGLALLYERDPDSTWLDASYHAMRYLARERAGASEVPADHWALLATARLLPLVKPGERTILIDHAVQVCESILRFQVDGSDPLRRGAFTADGRTTPTATRLEALLAALSFLPPEKTDLRRRIEAAVHEGIAFLLRAQVKTGPYVGAMPRAIASLGSAEMSALRSFNRRATEVRIDYVQHALSAMIQYRQRLPR